MSWTLGAVAAVAYLAVFGSVAAFLMLYTLLKQVPVSLLALVSYGFPIVAVALGFLILGETLEPQALAGAAAIVAGRGRRHERPGASGLGADGRRRCRGRVWRVAPVVPRYRSGRGPDPRGALDAIHRRERAAIQRRPGRLRGCHRGDLGRDPGRRSGTSRRRRMAMVRRVRGAGIRRCPGVRRGCRRNALGRRRRRGQPFRRDRVARRHRLRGADAQCGVLGESRPARHPVVRQYRRRAAIPGR